MKKSIIIFDVDDTMFYTINNVFEKINKVLELFNKSISYDIFINILKEKKNLISFIDSLSDIYKIDSKIILEKYIYFGKIISYKPIGDIKLIFRNLINKGYKLGIITNGPGYITYNKLISVDINPFIFDFILHLDNNLYPKPSNNIFNIQLKTFLSKYSNIYFVGDSLDDYYSTLLTGIEFYGVTTGFYSKEEFIKNGILKSFIFDSIENIDFSRLT